MMQSLVDKFVHCHFCRHKTINISVNSRNNVVVGYSSFYPIISKPRLLLFTAMRNKIQPFYIIFRKNLYFILIIFQKFFHINTINIDNSLRISMT